MFHKLQDQFDQVVRFVAIERHVEGNVRQFTGKSHSGRSKSFELQIELEKLTGNYGYSLVSRTMILNPFVVKKKGRAKIDHRKGARWKGGMEEAVMKKNRTWKSCGVLSNHDKWTCPLLKAMIAESRDNNNGESIQPL
ncbi:hypothetical protein GIB67_032475 [Kingdonia uniflora]|uniref:Uncharacterized protein n=1 Tax=Kingdonia uniflora TaxID=39325 RepID=A0A7J7L7H1_9MAGN|nr:hypothetical protein GIB67_032475 [Kingdonia uniflora]